MKTKLEIIQKIQEAEQFKDKVKTDPYRLKYHLMPLVGSLGDPNGMAQHQGIYHLYYLYSPRDYFNEIRGVNTWAHFSTKDFIHFKREPHTIYPDTLEDQNGIYSGCIYIENDVFHMLYTGNVRHVGNYDYVLEGREQNLIYTYSNDGIKFDFEKEVLMRNSDFPSHLTLHVRDPKVFKENGIYYMVLGARDKDDNGCVLLYQSNDLKSWQYIHDIKTKQPFGYMWECPDLIKINEQRYLITCPQGVRQSNHLYQNAHQCGYFKVSGDFKGDYKLEQFEQFDYGFDFYAARSFQDENNRTILIGWMGMPECEYTTNHVTKANGWQQCLAMPRVLEEKNGKLYQHPLEEMKELRKSHLRFIINNQLNLKSDCFELKVVLQHNSYFKMTIKKDCILEYCPDKQILSLCMNQSGDHRKIRTANINKLKELQIFVDTSSIEVFVNKGRITLTSRVFDLDNNILIEGSSILVDFYELNSYIIE